MFGCFRYLLASMVVLTHLWPAQTLWWGVYAVFGFFLLSGYLMTLVLDRSYGYTRGGLARYALNRVLRIYPPYLVVCAFALMLIGFLPQVSVATSVKLHLPPQPLNWLSNFAIFGMSTMRWHALVPPSWSLDIEVVHYALMGLLLSRHRAIVTSWFALSVAYTIFLLYTNAPLPSRYSHLPGATLPFATGAMLYVYRDRLAVLGSWTALISAPLFLGNAALAAYHPFGDPARLHFYLSLLFVALLVSGLSRLRPSDVPDWLRRLDKQAGNLSYPIFLAHWNVAVLVVWLGFEGSRPRDSFAFWAICFVLVNIAAWALSVCVDRRIDRVRDRVRKKRAARVPQSAVGPAGRRHRLRSRS